MNHPKAAEVLSLASSQLPLSPTTRKRKRRHFKWPVLCAYLIYDLSSPVFSTAEIDAVFSPPSTDGPEGGSPSSLPSSSRTPQTGTRSGNGWGTFLNSRMEHITNRSPSHNPAAICVGEYSSASVTHPCQIHGVGQIFHGWEDHPSTKRFKQMIASTPVIKPSGNGPAQILKTYLDEYNGNRSPLDVTWVLKFLLMPVMTDFKSKERWWESQDWQDLCKPKGISEKEFRPVALVCIRDAGFQRDDLARKLIEFGKLFSVEVMIVSSLG